MEVCFDSDIEFFSDLKKIFFKFFSVRDEVCLSAQYNFLVGLKLSQTFCYEHFWIQKNTNNHKNLEVRISKR